MDLCCDWGLIPSLAFNRRWKTKLSNHARALSRYLQPIESGTCPSNCHGRICFLCESYPPCLWACLYGQVIKTRRSDRSIKVERRVVIGAAWRFEQALRDSEDSWKLNTSFIERLNLTIRQALAHLFRRTICPARCKERLDDHLELLRCYCSFIRPHRALKFGFEIKTPAMQAGLVSKRLSFRAVSERIVFMILFIDATVDLRGVREQKMAA